jgi:hypothetical protein
MHRVSERWQPERPDDSLAADHTRVRPRSGTTVIGKEMFKQVVA